MKSAVLVPPAKAARPARVKFQPDPIVNPPADRPQNRAALKDWCLARADEWYHLGLPGPTCDLLKHASEIDPRDAQVWMALGCLHFELREYKEAGLTFHHAAQLEPANARIHLHLALTHQRLGHVEEAEGLYEVAMRLEPGHAQGLNLQGDFLMSLNRHDRARPCYEALLQRRPDDVDALLRLGVCNFRIKEYSTARHCFERILRIDPSHEIARENLTAVQTASPTV